MNDWTARLHHADAAQLRALGETARLAELRALIATAQRAERKEPARMPRTFFYDCEFLDDGRTIELISIGIVSADGREFYAVNADAPWKRIAKHQWLMTHVVPQLLDDPPIPGRSFGLTRTALIDRNHPAVATRAQIAAAVHAFLTGPDARGRALGEAGIALWTWYGAYDHVCLAQLWGPMSGLPPMIPMRSNDLKQEVERLGNPVLPEQPDGLHNALADARWLRTRYQWLKTYESNLTNPGSRI